MRMKLLMALLIFISASAFAQNRSVSGSVYSAEDNDPLIGATVKVKGSNQVTVTDMDGHFTIKNLSPEAKILEVSYVGYETQAVKIEPDMKIYMKSTTEMLDEMIVVAFGKQKRESFTGSASVVGAEQIERLQVTNPIEALNGTVTGVMMTEPNSFNTDPSITVRGLSSINASTEPLIVLDGMPYSGYWNDINPADIASMTVLKDAASNALYGARGANGVILITTKNAQKGRTKVTLNAKWGANDDGRVRYNTVDDPGQYYEAFYLAYKNYYLNKGVGEGMAHLQSNDMIGKPIGEGGLGYMVYSVPEGQVLIGSNGRLNPNATLGNRIANNGSIYTLYPDDWTKEGLRNGLRQEYNVSVASGNDKYTFYGNLGYLGNQGLSYGSDIERISARLKADVQLFPFIKIGSSASYNHTTTNSMEEVYEALIDMGPIYPLYIRDEYGKIMTDSHGKMYDYGDGKVIGLQRQVDQSGNYVQEDMLNEHKNVTNAFNMQGFANVDFLDGFHFTINGSSYITEYRINYGYNPWYGYDTGQGSISTYHYRISNFNTQQLLNYSKEFNGHNIDLLLGHEYTLKTTTYLSGSRSKPVLYDNNKELAGAIVNKSTNGYISNYNVEGWFLRAQYDYQSKIFASASFRRDGSSRFHKDHRWGNFWSVGAAWIMTKEDWFPRTQALNMLKLKASYGEQGNDGIGNYRYTNTYSINNTNGEAAFVFDKKGNPNITWETVGCFNTGVEFELFNSRLNGGIEFYTRETRDMLTSLSTPYSIGYTSYYDNVGNMNNKGVEISLNSDLISTRNFSWNLGINFSWERNRVSKLPDDKKQYNQEGHPGYTSGSFYYSEGLPLYTWRLKKFAGVNEDGLALFYKNNSDKTIGTTTDYDEANYYLCGSALPDAFGSIMTSFSFFGVDISAQFNYSIGGKKYDTVYSSLMTSPYSENLGAPFHKDVFNAWTKENTTSEIPIFMYGNEEATYNSDRFLTDASYISLKNISVGYTFPKTITRKMYMSNLRVFCQLDNVYYWSKRKGFDPRQSNIYGSYDSDSGYAFPMRTISGGLTIEF